MRVKLLKSLKMAKDGILITQYAVGDIIEVADANGESLITQCKAELYHTKVIDDIITKSAHKEHRKAKTRTKK